MTQNYNSNASDTYQGAPSNSQTPFKQVVGGLNSTVQKVGSKTNSFIAINRDGGQMRGDSNVHASKTRSFVTPKNTQ